MSDSVKTVRTMVELAKVFNVSQPRISQWKKQGMPIQDDGSYNIKNITVWRALKATEKVKSLLPSTIENGDLQVVNEVVSGLNRFRALVDDFKKDRSDIFAGVEAKLISVAEEILDSVNKSEILAIPLKERLRFVKDIVSSISSLYVSERLEKGESTGNIAVIIQAIKDAKRRKAEEKRQKPSMVQDGNQNT